MNSARVEAGSESTHSRWVTGDRKLGKFGKLVSVMRGSLLHHHRRTFQRLRQLATSAVGSKRIKLLFYGCVAFTLLVFFFGASSFLQLKDRSYSSLDRFHSTRFVFLNAVLSLFFYFMAFQFGKKLLCFVFNSMRIRLRANWEDILLDGFSAVLTVKCKSTCLCYYYAAGCVIESN